MARWLPFNPKEKEWVTDINQRGKKKVVFIFENLKRHGRVGFA